METFYSIQKCYYDNEILIQSDVLTPVLLGQHFLTQEQLPLLNIPCHVSLGKKCNDFIFYEGIPHVFFSQRMVDIFAGFVDVSKYFYPIKIEGMVNAQYYIDICWPKVQYLKQKDDRYPGIPPHFHLLSPMPPIATLVKDGVVVYLCSTKIKNTFERYIQEPYNYSFVEYSGLTDREYNQWKMIYKDYI